NVPSEKRRGIRGGAKITFFSIVLFPIFFLLCFAVDGPGPLVVPATLFLMGVVWMLFYWLFGYEDLPVQKQTPDMSPTVQPVYLPPPQNIPIPNRSPIDTSQPQSVVENTTRSLGQ